MTAHPAQHSKHFTSVLNRMTPHEHDRRWLCFAVGVAVVSYQDNAFTFTSDRFYPHQKMTRLEAVTGNLFARGSDALFDAGSVATAEEAMKFNPLDWTTLWHTLSDDERYDGISDWNAKMSVDLKYLLETDTIQAPEDFFHFKLSGVYVADALEKSLIARSAMKNRRTAPFTVDLPWLVGALGGAENVTEMMMQADRKVSLALADRGKALIN